jgi:nicotinate-nucleotide adenylyltransferase
MKKIGIFSGTFDPFHVAHLEACLVSKAVCELETIAVMVEHSPHRKENVTAYKHRLAMVDLAIQSYPSLRLVDTGVENITATNILDCLHQQFPVSEFWYIFGSDMLYHLPKWNKLDVLTKEFKFCVVLRHNDERTNAEKLLKELKKTHRKLEYKILPEVWSSVSSSRIRNQVAETSYSDLIHRDVLKYILTNNLY